MTDMKRMTIEELQAEVLKLSERKFRAAQIFSWIHKEKASDFSEMTNLPKDLRERLSAAYELPHAEITEMRESRLDGTRKYLLKFADGNVIESVLMRYDYGNSLCVSTEVGCAMGCAFCASTKGGLLRRLSASEILDEFYTIENDIGEPINHVVLMGSGEPFDNYDEVVRFISLLCDPWGRNLSKRNITLSTCGLPGKIRDFADLNWPVTLALSLHAYHDERRRELMPIAKKYPLSDVMAACDYYFEKTGRRLTMEYALVSGVNDSETDARNLAALLKGRGAHVNLIPVNEIKEKNYRKPEDSAVRRFQKILENNGANATIRRSMGSDISGSCGQLRNHYIETH